MRYNAVCVVRYGASILINAHPSGLQSRNCYTITRSNMMIDKSTRVICQGFTGKQVLATTL